jgi:3-hydroxyisobutyrate dehydrogenase-like beta-hydroxyacid dehydrogenase
MNRYRIHVLGLGKMGLPMATLLVKAGHECTVSDPDAERVARARDRDLLVVGAVATRVLVSALPSASSLVQSSAASRDMTLAPSADLMPALTSALTSADIVVSSLPDDTALLAVAKQLCSVVSPGAIWIDTSTVSAQASAQAAAQCEGVGLRYLRATISGNNHMMEAAQVTIMASGPRLLYDEMSPILRCFGPTIFYLGEAEQARLMKLVINLMIVQTSSMLAEALTLGEKGGLDWQNMWAVIAASAVGSPIVKAKSVQLSRRDFSPTFTVPQMIKDVELMLGEAERLQVPLPQTTLTHQALLACLAQGFGEDDYASIIRISEAAAGIVS